MLSDQLSYLKRAFFRLENQEFFSRFFLYGQFYRLENTKRNALDLAEFRNQVQYSVSERVGDRFILKDVIIIYSLFGRSQSPVSSEITTIAFLTRETSVIIPKKLLKKELTSTSHTFQGSFNADFCAKASLVNY